ncbi:uncharacterized protein METZ01_LOCUS438311, partial [marine metagenome]
MLPEFVDRNVVTALLHHEFQNGLREFFFWRQVGHDLCLRCGGCLSHDLIYRVNP